MLEWLKAVLGDAYTEDIEKKVSDEIGKGFIARGDHNALIEVRKTLEGQIADRDKQLENLKKTSGDAETWKTKVSDLQKENQEAKDALEALEKKHASELADRDFDALLTGELTAAKAKNATALKALLDIDALKKSKDQTVDIKSAVEKAKTEYDYLFESDEPHKNPVGPTRKETPPGDAETAALRAIMGLPAEKKGD